MRILILRPEAEGRRVAAILEARGHQAILSPIIQITPTSAPIPSGPFDFVVATSANALQIVNAVPGNLRALPLYGVGTQVADAAKTAGFASVFASALTVAHLAWQIRTERKVGSRALYLAGLPRKPDLEAALLSAKMSVTTVEVYHAHPVAKLSPAATEAIRPGVDIVLHFSRASASAAIEAFEQTKTLDSVAMARHLCLSGDIASALVSRLDWRIEIAREPTLDAMLALIDASEHV